ncbi:HNH endonuclease [Aerococcus kribbianus]|uniref:Putative HNH nuclease YajD n=1 Tax=Aerococcus kribbianus TaxID=2999064 RepID=A0A9X3FQR3_9LACT|nr:MULTISPECIES: HNH endonuclease [unclassified Aerococcus]MCZ0717842.1 HNH endonuclease [Aerococcus sp. YH-aer221]MCZ0726129.1 HNH endonuclease [Aerococcus sp. YH-aer222]
MNKKERRQFYNSTKWRKLRQQILLRDHYECQLCKAEGRVTTGQTTVLEVDHIKELEHYPELATDPDNLRTLCKECHNKRHHRFNYRPNKKQQNKWEGDEWLDD